MQVIDVPVPEAYEGNRVVCCVVTRSGREKYLKRTLAALAKQPVDIMVWANGPIDIGVLPVGTMITVHPFNVGQHVAHNSMLDDAVRHGHYDWHIRVDDDCWIRGKNWLTRLLKAQEEIKKLRGKYAVMSVNILGLNSPPPTVHSYDLGSEIIHHVGMLGGIFRMSPMGLIRYFRWDERQAMGFGDATQFANFCASTDTDMFRLQDVKATHGDSTSKQNDGNEAWSHEHDMLQYMPLGL